MTEPLFLRACRNERVERRPVWMMRQAGRYLPEYRALRAENDFLTLCRTPELAAEVTLQPVRRLGVDAAIVFADILLPLDAMGAGLYFAKGEGPCFERPVRSREQAARLREPEVEKDLAYVYDTLRLVKGELPPEVPLIGFGGTPWTLAAYLVEGGTSKHHAQLLAWSYRDPDGLRVLLDRLAEISVRYLEAQIDAGAQAIQLFDTWGGLLDAERWRRLSRPGIVRIAEALRTRVPVVYYVNGGGHLLGELGALPVDVLSVDWRLPLDEARRRIGSDQVLQGNLDPAALLGSEEEIVERTLEMLRAGAGGGHVANLGHGILPMVPPENAQLFIDTVKTRSAAFCTDESSVSGEASVAGEASVS